MHGYAIRGEKQEEEVEDNKKSQAGRGNLSLKFYSSSSTRKTLRRETEKWDSLWDLEIKNSSNKCEIRWVGGGSGVWGFFFFFTPNKEWSLRFKRSLLEVS